MRSSTQSDIQSSLLSEIDPRHGDLSLADAWMPLRRLSLLSLRKGIAVREEVNLFRCIAHQLTCKFLYLVFPRDIHYSARIVEKTVAQKI
jgi:hypothetical protein